MDIPKWRSILLAGICLVPGTSTLAGGIVIPPNVHTVGPGNDCDYPDLQTAIDDVFDCVFACAPLFDQQFRLADNYQHDGKITIRDSLAVIGGYDTCQSPSNGGQLLINNSGGPGALITVAGSASKPVDVSLIGLALVGNNSVADAGGVVRVQQHARVRLENARVTGGDANQGGGIALTGGDNRLELRNATVSSNRALADGGGIWCQDGGAIDFQSGLISGNTAETRGGGIAIDNCTVTGSGLNLSREINSNAVLRSSAEDAPGKGGGVYARGSSARIVLGGLLSATRIQNNEVTKWTAPLRTAELASGGGLHLQQGAQAILRNVQFIENEAPNGGAVSMESGSQLDMDRTSGPCLSTRASECSALIGNSATGQSVGSDNIRVGDGSAVYAPSGAGVSVTLRRTSLRENAAVDHDGQGFLLDPSGGSLVSMDGQTSTISQNLMFSNVIEGGTSDLGRYFNVTGDLLRLQHNTIVFNNDAEQLVRPLAPVEAVGNIFLNPELDSIHNQGAFAASICNLADQSISAVTSGSSTSADPMFVDVSTADFHLLPGSPAINRCDNETSTLPDLGFDIAGRARPAEEGGDPVLGFFDTGALEYQVGPPTEVDLKIDLDVDGSPPEMTATLTNQGLTDAAAGNYRFRVVSDNELVPLDGNWSCTPGPEDNEDTCALDNMFSLAVGATTIPFAFRLTPDSEGTCLFSLEAVAVAQSDTVAGNNSVGLSLPDCDGDGSRPDDLFADSFETSP